MNIIVVGAGSIGCAVIHQMMTAGHTVTVVARNRRLAQLQTEGLCVKRVAALPWERTSYTQQPVSVVPTLSPELPGQIIIVTVQRHQLSDLTPALLAHPAKSIVFMCNYAGDLDQLARPFGERLLWAFPAMLAGVNAATGKAHYSILPRSLSSLQITTIGSASAEPSSAAMERSRELLELFNQAGIPSSPTTRMGDWLKTHAALMLPLIASGVAHLRQGRSLQMTWQEAGQAARAMKESFALIRQVGLSLQPLNIRLLGLLAPAPLIQVFLFFIFRTRGGQAALHDHAEHAAGEVAQLWADLQGLAERKRLPLPNLQSLCAPALSNP